MNFKIWCDTINVVLEYKEEAEYEEVKSTGAAGGRSIESRLSRRACKRAGDEARSSERDEEEPKQDEPVSEEEIPANQNLLTADPGSVRCGDRKTTGSRYGE